MMLHLCCVLLCFQADSGPKINLNKSELVRICDRRDENELAEVFGCEVA